MMLEKEQKNYQTIAEMLEHLKSYTEIASWE